MPVLLLAGCGWGTRRPLVDPFQPGAARELSLYTIAWWKKLVEAPSLEFGPREPAAAGVAPGGAHVLTATRDGVVRSFDARGREEWRSPFGSPFNAGPLVAGEVAYVPGSDGVVTALHVKTGKQIWRTDAGEELVTTPVLAGDRLLVASQTDTLYAIEAESGRFAWQYRRDTPTGFTIRGASTPAVRDGVAYLGFSDGHVAAVSVADGSLLWDRALSTGTQFIDIDSRPGFTPAGQLVVTSYKDGLFALDPQNGNTVWKTAALGLTRVLVQGPVIFAAGDNALSAYAADTGLLAWTTPLERRAGMQPSLAGPYLLVSTGSALLFLDPISGRLLHRFDPGKGVTAPATVQGRDVYVVSNLGFVYALQMHGNGRR